MFAIGVMGFFMRRYDFPIAPVILGVILGPLMETQARRALVGSGDDFGVFVGRPLTVVLLVIAIAALVVPHLPRLAAWRKERQAFAEED
jgi:putative tricarboxylic transport membrane protein